MKPSLIPRRVFLAALAVLAIGSVACAGERPIKGSGSGDLDYGASRLNASGRVTHLGNSGLLIYVDQSSLDFGNVYLYFCVFTAANGDVLTSGIPDQHFNPETGVLTATISFNPAIEGRFDDAEGTASLLIVFEDWIGTGPYEGHFDFVLGGTIDY